MIQLILHSFNDKFAKKLQNFNQMKNQFKFYKVKFVVEKSVGEILTTEKCFVLF